MHTYRIRPDITVLSDQLEVPGIGFLAVNAFVLHATEPVVIDTGVGLADRDFVDSLGSVVDPQDVRWIWLTHPDRDHTGGLFRLLEAAPQARLVTTYIGAPLPTADLAGDSGVDDVPPEALRAGQLLWATVDSPWVHTVDTDRYLATVQPLRAMDPEIILSTHLPPAIGHIPEFLEMLVAAPHADPFVGPDQAALEQLLASFETGRQHHPAI